MTTEIARRRRRAGALGELLPQPGPLRRSGSPTSSSTSYFAGREAPPELIAAPLELARRAAAMLRDRRRGSALEISTTEPEFEFDAEGAVVAAHSVDQTEAHGLIEQLMICANERVAEHCERRGVPTSTASTSARTRRGWRR